MSHKSDKLLIFSQRFPPSVGGTPTVMGNLIDSLMDQNLTVLSLAEIGEKYANQVEFEHYRLRPNNKIIRKLDPIGLSIIPRVIGKAKLVHKKHNSSAVLSVFPGTPYMIASYLFSIKHDIPLFPYFLDTWPEARWRRIERAISKYYESKVIERAQKVYVLTPALRDHFLEKYPKCRNKLKIIPHSVRYPFDLPPPQSRWNHNGTHIVYTGQIYRATFDPIKLLLESFHHIEELNPKLTISSPETEKTLKSYGLWNGERLTVVNLEHSSDVAGLQASADILFNPVSFDFENDKQTQTLYPTKTFEYLKARKPMLVCGPGTTSFVKQAKLEKFAYVVDKKDAQLLAQTIKLIVEQKLTSEMSNTYLDKLSQHSTENISHKILSSMQKI